jgi:hypothetical protein
MAHLTALILLQNIKNLKNAKFFNQKDLWKKMIEEITLVHKIVIINK